MMIKKIIFTVLILVGYVGMTNAQNQSANDPVLFTVGNTPVKVSEFLYVYNKSNGTNKADFSQKSLDEYLDLYVKFKLKVQKAKDLKIDTIPSLQKELEGYRRQLASTYLMDKEVMGDLVEEAYERMQSDVNISHIFIAADETNDADVLKKMNGIKDEISKGKLTFEVAAGKYSDDEATKLEGGTIGFITAFYLRNFYEIENAAYNTPVGKVSAPVRSRVGYHLIKVNEKRPARGEMEIAHILLRVTNPGEEGKAQQIIRQAHKELEGGLTFEEGVKKYSQDEKTKSKNGVLGIASIGKYEANFEQNVFSLQKDGAYSKPFRSSVGWHIVKRVKKRDLLPLNQMSRSLKARVQRDSRFNVVQEKFIERLKEENTYSVDNKVMSSFVNSLDKSFLTLQWKAKQENYQSTLFTIANQSTTLGELVTYLSRSGNARVRNAKDANPADVFQGLYDNFVKRKLLAYEEAQLPTKYPDFKSLMREYEEGILLFEATNLLVWGKAAKDTVGLEKYYKKHKKDYLWNKRVEVTTYSMPNEYPTKFSKARKIAKKGSPEKVLAKIKTEKQTILTAESKSYEKGQNSDVDDLKWKKGYLSGDILKGDVISFLKIEAVIKPQPKEFSDARGYVIADYQEHLMEKWIGELQKEYKIKINKDVFNSLIKK